MNYHLTNIFADQKLSDTVLELASMTASPERSYWKMISCRLLTGYENDGRAARLFRMDPTKEWKWKDDELSQTVKALVEPFVHHYSRLTRVELLIQKPGESVYCHKDRITGQSYDDGISIGTYAADWFRHAENCNADPLLHEQQHYLGGRLALGPEGRSYLMDNQTKSYYTTKNEFFFLNEDALHGADSVDFWRGVVFFDGVHNPEVMKPYYV